MGLLPPAYYELEGQWQDHMIADSVSGKKEDFQ